MLPGGLQAAVLTGRVFTADSPDSVLALNPIEVVYQDASGQTHRHATTTDAMGRFLFDGLEPEGRAYVLSIKRGGREFLSEPIHFQAGQDTLVYDVMLVNEPPPSGPLPAGHPPVGGVPPHRPVDSPLWALAIVVGLAVLFAYLFHLSGETPEAARQRRYPPRAVALMRDLAALDLRRERGEIGEEEYAKVREGLKRRLLEILRDHPPVG
jgi:hypothetical protein